MIIVIRYQLLTLDVAFRIATINYLAKVLSFITNKEGTQLDYKLMKIFAKVARCMCNNVCHDI